MNDAKLTLRLATEADMPYLKEKIKEAFAIAAVERFGENEADKVPHADQLEKAYRLEKSCSASGCRVYCVMKGGAIVGGAVLMINEKTWNNKLDFKEQVTLKNSSR